MVCTHTLYNEVWAGSLDLSVTELPEAMKRKQHKDSKPREHKKNFGTDISQRPEIAALRIEEGHWEGDTVVGKRGSKEAVVLSLLEKKTENYIAIRIPGKDADSVLNAMQSLREEFGDKFSQVFKSITVDNGSEFSAFSQVENWGCAVYFAHPYTSWERPQNERHNGLFRAFVPKGVSIEAFSAEYILAAADELNGRPRKKLGYRTPEELFDENGRLIPELQALAPTGDRRMGANPHANGGRRRRDLLQVVPEHSPAQPNSNRGKPPYSHIQRGLQGRHIHCFSKGSRKPKQVVPVAAAGGGIDFRGVIQLHPAQLAFPAHHPV